MFGAGMWSLPTSLPSKYEKHYRINDSLCLGMALSQNPQILYYFFRVSLPVLQRRCAEASARP